jgi:outer membrane murein-binding lipoprotein Lpp
MRMRPEHGAPDTRMRAMKLKLTAVLPVMGALLLTGCASDNAVREREPRPVAPVVDRNAASVAALTEDLALLQRLAQAAPAEQAEIIASAQRDYETAPTPSRQLRFALVLSNPGHPATDLPRAQRLLRELMANPEMLLSGERALAFLELQQIDDHLTLEAENRRLQGDAVRADRERLGTVNRRLQLETDENARLRKELEEARAKLDAIANIERSLNERKPNNQGPQP